MKADRKVHANSEPDIESTAIDGPDSMGCGAVEESVVPQSGDVIFGRFLLLEKIGSGGSGSVHRALDQKAHHEVAIKLLRRPAHLRRFKSEYRLQRRLLHEHLLSPGELFVSGEMAAITMPFVRGSRSLTEAISECREAERTDWLGIWFAQLARVLGELHRSGIVHCDIKPSNVLVDAKGDVRLIDLGAASVHGENWGLRAGTPLYVAPEVAEGEEPTPMADWYSFGITLWEAVSGHPPLLGSRIEVMDRKLAGAVPDLWPEVAQGAMGALARGLIARDPRDRASPEEIFRALGVSRPLPSECAAFVGRDAELEALERYRRNSQRGGATVVNVRGESGIGKTRLVQEFCRRVARKTSPPLIFKGSCSGFESVPYNVLDEVFEQVKDVISVAPFPVPKEIQADYAALGLTIPGFDSLYGRLDPGKEALGASEAGTRSVSALCHLLATLASRHGSLIVCLDQLTWADSDSAQVVSEIVRRSPRLPLLVLQLARTDSVQESAYLKEQLSLQVPSSLLEVGDLLPDDVARLLGDGVNTVGDGNPQRLLRRRKGTAFFQTVPRLALFTAQFLAVAAQPISIEVVKQALGAEAVNSTVLRVLEEQGLIQRERRGTVWVFVPVHDQTLELLVEPLSSGEKRGIHLALAGVLRKQVPISHGSVAEHFIAAGAVRRASVHAELAAAEARRAAAFDAEVRWLRFARDGLFSDKEEHLGRRRVLSKKLAAALADAGCEIASAEEYLSLAKGQEQRQRRDFRFLALGQLMRVGHLDHGMLLLDELLKEAGLPNPSTSARAAARLVIERYRLKRALAMTASPSPVVPSEALFAVDASRAARSGYMLLDFTRGLYFSALALRLALESGDPERIALGLLDEILFVSVGGTKVNSRTEALIQRARGLARGSNDSFLSTYLEVADGGAKMLSGEFYSGYRKLAPLERRLKTAHPEKKWELTFCRMLLIASAQFGGFLEESERMLLRWLGDAEMREDRTAQRSFYPELVFNSLARGDVQRAQSAYERARRLSEGDAQTTALLLNQRYYLALYGNPDIEELRSLRRGYGAFHRSLLRFSQGLRVIARAYEIALDLEIMIREGNSWLGISRISANVKKLTSEGARYADAHAAMMKAALRRLQGQEVEVEELMNEAKQGFLKELPLLAAVVDYRLAELFPKRYSILGANLNLKSMGVRDPGAFARMLAPGFSIGGPSDAS
jgi:hypothetical protein